MGFGLFRKIKNGIKKAVTWTKDKIGKAVGFVKDKVLPIYDMAKPALRMIPGASSVVGALDTVQDSVNMYDRLREQAGALNPKIKLK